MSNYIRCDQCGCDSLDTDTLRCSCGSDAPTSCAAAERFNADLAALRERLAAVEAELADLRHFKATRTTHSTLKTRAETAEALVRELAAVVKAAEAYRDRGWKASGRIDSFVKVRNAYDFAIAALSPAARKEIEG